MSSLPRLLITLGDVAGIGPEIVARAWPMLPPVPAHRRRRSALAAARPGSGPARRLGRGRSASSPRRADARPLPCLAASDAGSVAASCRAQVSAAAGRAAYDFLCRAIDRNAGRRADGIVTAPLHKEGLHGAGLPYPGHTEILAERTGTQQLRHAPVRRRPGRGSRHAAHGPARRLSPPQHRRPSARRSTCSTTCCRVCSAGRRASASRPSIRTPATAACSATRKRRSSLPP